MSPEVKPVCLKLNTMKNYAEIWKHNDTFPDWHTHTRERVCVCVREGQGVWEPFASHTSCMTAFHHRDPPDQEVRSYLCEVLTAVRCSDGTKYFLSPSWRHSTEQLRRRRVMCEKTSPTCLSETQWLCNQSDFFFFLRCFVLAHAAMKNVGIWATNGTAKNTGFWQEVQLALALFPAQSQWQRLRNRNVLFRQQTPCRSCQGHVWLVPAVLPQRQSTQEFYSGCTFLTGPPPTHPPTTRAGKGLGSRFEPGIFCMSAVNNANVAFCEAQILPTNCC